MEVGDEDSVEIQLTEDGENGSPTSAYGDTTSDKRMRARATWFKDSQKLTNRSDARKVVNFLLLIH